MSAKCVVCGFPLIPKAPGRIVLDGFVDTSNNNTVHFSCRDEYYTNMYKPKPATYSPGQQMLLF